MTPRTLIILPMYDEALSVLNPARGIMGTAAATEVPIMTDNSPDATGDLVAKAAQAPPHAPRQVSARDGRKVS